MTKVCDNASVGVLINAFGRTLMIERGTAPAGLAPVAGHVYDEHADYYSAARAEVSEEIGATVDRLDPITGGWRPNRCRRNPGPRGYGHQWRVFRATLTGPRDADGLPILAPSDRETKGVRWLDPAGIHAAARRTLAYSAGQISEAEWLADPGIEPVWVRWLADAGLGWTYTLTGDEMAIIDARAAAPIT